MSWRADGPERQRGTSGAAASNPTLSATQSAANREFRCVSGRMALSGTYRSVLCSLRAGKAPLRASLGKMCDGFLSGRPKWFGFGFALLGLTGVSQGSPAVQRAMSARSGLVQVLRFERVRGAQSSSRFFGLGHAAAARITHQRLPALGCGPLKRRLTPSLRNRTHNGRLRLRNNEAAQKC